MKKNEEYLKAKANYEDLQERGMDAIGENALEFIDTLLTEEEIIESNLRVALFSVLIKARQENNISQKKLEKLSGVKQPIIARMEKGTTNPKIDTILKLLIPLGKTLAIVPLKKQIE